jgi:hypothetical protein
MGFKSEKEYTQFLENKLEALMDMIKGNPELMDVFKRLKDK